ncbi:MAG TPA: hydroxymethylbilane synthase, partial [Terriglobales bacterium]|nr:hydroxymethylbilane synthase [Terriglobales bacterium]
GTKGMFTKEIEEALAAGAVDLAVHSLKDLPTELPAAFRLAAVPKRESPQDALLSIRYTRLADLPQGARVGTSSLRRQAQLKAVRPDLNILSLRGNVDTRLRKLQAGEFDAIVLAAAGLNRLGRTEMVRELISVETMCPAAGQGALGIEARADDPATLESLRFLDDADARVATACERALLNALGGGCQVPIGAHAERAGNQLKLTAVVARPDGSKLLREARLGEDPEKLGIAVGRTLLERGADQILKEVYGSAAAVPQQP